MQRKTGFKLLCALLGLWVSAALAQSPNGTISGIVLDPTGRAIVSADVVVVNDATGVRYSTVTNGEGIYAIPNLPPGPYRLQVSKYGFKTLIKPEIVLNTQDALAINFTLPVGATSESITVEAGAPLVNTESGSVGTVVGRKLVENLPLNGRSFNTLLQLTPGVVIAPSSSSNQGQFSVAGQRTSSNNLMVDGVSGNFGVAPTFGLGTSGTGSAQAFSVLGGTSSLVSVEALQEFRVETSSFAPEFGRSAGGQVMLTTRSGTNDLHGGIYEYFRNDVLDANDWFANRAQQPRAPERHNDFGVFLGGPLQKNKTFFFASYEGVRLRQPNTTVTVVPSEYARSVAPAAVAPFLAAYPRPDDPTVTPGVFTALFTGNYSNPSTLNAGSLRLDHIFSDKWSAFVRYNEAPSEGEARSNSLSELDTRTVDSRTVTAAVTFTPNSRLSDSFRANYSLQRASFLSAVDSFGGAVPPDPALFGSGLVSTNTFLEFITYDTSYYAIGPSARNRNVQLNFADDVGIAFGTHQLKIGVDYREIRLNLHPYQNSIGYITNTVSGLLASGQTSLYAAAARPSDYISRTASLYAQDSWKITPRLSMNYGLRWELSPAPAAANGTRLVAWTDPANLATFGLAPQGTPPWKTVYTNFGPRLGLAYSLNSKGDFILRGGWGVFYDLPSDAIGYLGAAFPNATGSCCVPVTLPVADMTPYLPAIASQAPYPDATRGYAPDLELPRSYQWNLALEKSFAGSQAISLTYVGQTGRRLLKQVAMPAANANFLGSFLLTENAARSNYAALQVQYRRPMAGRLQALLSYSWAHSLDSASDDTLTAIAPSFTSGRDDYASSNFDVRHSFSGAVIFAVPGIRHAQLLHAFTRDWLLNAMVVARAGFPFNASALTTTLAGAFPRADRLPGEPVWIANSAAPGGKSLNPAAFAVPSTGRQGTEARNDLSGFGLTQVDLSLGRKFALSERLALQFRTDAFNVLNHPNFTNPLGYVGFGTAYLQSRSMLNKGLGGLNSLFQQGGPRSLQLSLKLSF